jgi:hypothetical protein
MPITRERPAPSRPDPSLTPTAPLLPRGRLPGGRPARLTLVRRPTTTRLPPRDACPTTTAAASPQATPLPRTPPARPAPRSPSISASQPPVPSVLVHRPGTKRHVSPRASLAATPDDPEDSVPASERPGQPPWSRMLLAVAICGPALWLGGVPVVAVPPSSPSSCCCGCACAAAAARLRVPYGSAIGGFAALVTLLQWLPLPTRCACGWPPTSSPCPRPPSPVAASTPGPASHLSPGTAPSRPPACSA